MKTTTFLTDKLYQYMQTVSLREHPVLQELRSITASLTGHMMQVPPEQAQFMALLIELIGAKKALELGVYTGYSSTAIALALPADGQLIACDISDQFSPWAQRTWEKAGVSSKIHFHITAAEQLLNSLLEKGQANSFDFIFIDADKINYDLYYEKCLLLVRQGGLIIIDNTFWSGRVADTTDNDAATEAIRQLNKKILMDQRVSLSLVPIGDGVTLVRKK